jgi:uncharacterized protein (DUF1786 family)
MRLLCLDVGSGTQDVLLLDTKQSVENAVQMVLPSPTVLVAQKIKAATARGDPIILVGETMGGGPSTHALKRHLEAGFKVYATPEAARSFSDYLETVASWGVELVSSDEVASLETNTLIRTEDINLQVIERALSSWGIRFAPDVVSVAVLDHGAAPPSESQRLFRFRQLEHLLEQSSTLESFIFTPAELPDYFTRMQAVARSLGKEVPLVLMDTGASAVLGASLDRIVASHRHRLTVNLGNSHTLAFLLDDSRVLGLFEHHTSRLSLAKLEELLKKLVSAGLEPREVWEDGGHGSLSLETGKNPFLVATGPQRSLLGPSNLSPYFAVPFGNMMLAGCFGLAKAVAIRYPEWRDEIEGALIVG